MTREALNRQSFIDASLEVIAEAGVDKLSMRRVASRLGVSPMAMYKHFPNKEELLAASLDEFIARAAVIPAASLPWEQWVEAVSRGMYQALCQQDSWVPLLGSLRLGARAAAVTDAFVSKLCSAGFTTEQAVRAYFAVIQLVVGAVCLRSSLKLELRLDTDTDSDLNPVTRAYLENIDSERLRIAPELDRVLKLDQLDIGLPLLIGALQAQLRREDPQHT